MPYIMPLLRLRMCMLFMNSEVVSLKSHFGEQSQIRHTQCRPHCLSLSLITQSYSTVTPVTSSHISALFTALCGLSLSKVSNLVPNLHELSTSFQAHISKHTGLILEPKSTFKSNYKKKQIILNKIFNHHIRRNYQTTQVWLLEYSLGTWWPIKPEATLLVIKYVLVKHVLCLTSLTFFTYPSPHTDSPH